MDPPKLDHRTFTALLNQPEWRSRPREEVGMVLAAIYAHYLEILLDRLNRVPDKNLLVFLDLLGVGRLPPGVATAPIVFTLAPTAGEFGFVPEGTQVATVQTETEPAVIYETEQDLNVIAAQMVAAYVIEPDRDRYSNLTPVVTGQESWVFSPFRGDQIIKHHLFLGLPDDRPLFATRSGQLQVLVIPREVPESPEDLIQDLSKSLQWDVQRGEDWQPIEPSRIRYSDEINSVILQFDDIQKPELKTLRGLGLLEPLLQRWLIRARLTRPLLQGDNSLITTRRIARIQLRPNITNGIQPDAGALGTALLDISSPFYPFGVQPKLNDIFYIGSQEALRQPGARVRLNFELSQKGEPSPGVSHDDSNVVVGNLYFFRLVWEYFNGQGWKALGNIEYTFKAGEKGFTLTTIALNQIEDTTNGFASSGFVSFQVPEDIAISDLAGQSNYWVRVRIAAGDYGRSTEFVLVRPDIPREGFRVKQDTGNLQSPIVESLTLTYDYQATAIQPLVVSQDGFIYRDLTTSNQKSQGLTEPLFVLIEEDLPTCYWGFNRPLPSQTSVNLYFLVPPRQVTEQFSTPVRSRTPTRTESSKPELRWEYYNGRVWTELFVIDTTSNLTESGSVQFFGPADMRSLQKFESTERYWIRVRLLQSSSDYAPQLSGIFLNTIRVAQKTTVKEELLGSSNGRENQRVRLAKSPVLPGQRIRIREPERPSTEKAVAIQAEIGEATVQVTTATDGSQVYWVYWQEVKTLNGSGAHSRHYTLDRITGEVRFGDGKHGLIPPEGRDNIVCEVYQAGGGAGGNQPAGKINQLKTSIPYITAVTNPVAADGGSEPETVAAAKERGPQSLKHRDRAITASDYEWLARQTVGTRVARARVLPNRNRSLQFERGWVTIIIVPEGAEKKLLPSAELIRAVEDHLASYSLVTLSHYIPDHINVVGPGYIPVEVIAEVVPVTLTQANTVRKTVLEALDRFFHPLIGGPDRSGWAFGRDVYLSELYAAFEALPGVDHIKNLQFKPTVASLALKVSTPMNYPLPASTQIEIANAEQRLQFRLTEDCLVGKTDLLITLFQEGDRITLTPINNFAEQPLETTIHSISGDTLTVAPFRTGMALDRGSEVASKNGTKSFLTVPLAANSLITSLVVQGIVPEHILTVPGGQTFTLQGRGAPPDRRLNLGQRLRVPESFLVYSGNHTITIVPS